ncbi:tetratricopeptide repeat protein [Actinomadura darangshiensis]|uniref:Tetratricopeptide repeat protein n=1 Tax=Actinomadura darangshiensis TaxID=705336 RepID=A0A4R5B8R7_9ACTN|nr:tetratricopeptide repeat protein [Actinomadura darangshiensis]TDD81030.1 tetratricopeptide repeat protein [Actinomadura darangshiensis]
MHVHKGVHLHRQMHVMPDSRPAVHRSILCVDIEGFGGRSNWDQLVTRAGLYQALQDALAESGVPSDSCYCEDRGDGAMILVGPDVPKERLAESFPAALAAMLDRHNSSAPAGARIRIRVAVHAGEVHYDGHGVAGGSLTTTFRLLDAAPLKDALRDSPGVLALIASGWFYDEVIRQSPACGAASFRAVDVAVKETRTRAWIRLPDAPGDGTRVLRLLALHPGTEISVLAAAALLGVPGDEAHALLGGLRLEECAEGRYRVPALDDRLDDRERTVSLRRVLAWYLGTADNARRLLCPDRVTAPFTLPDEPCRPLTFTCADDAHRWCESERLNLIAAARVAADEGHHDIAWRLPLALWAFFFLRSPWTDWIDALRTGLASARSLGDDRGIAYALAGLGYAGQYRWQLEESVDLFTAAREVFSRIGDPRGEAWALHGLGYACRRLHRYRDAAAHHRRSVRLSGEAGDLRSTGLALSALGYAHAGLNEFGMSLTCFQQAHTIARQTDRRAEGWALHGLGYAHQGLHRFERAVVCYEEALRAFDETGDRPGQGETLYNLGQTHLHLADPDAARDCWMRALAIFEDLQTPQTAGVLARLRSLDPRS